MGPMHQSSVIQTSQFGNPFVHCSHSVGSINPMWPEDHKHLQIMLLLHREQMVPPLKYVEHINTLLSKMRDLITFKRVTHIVIIVLYRVTHTSDYVKQLSIPPTPVAARKAHRLFDYRQFVERMNLRAVALCIVKACAIAIILV
jgi:hypothetical protein